MSVLFRNLALLMFGSLFGLIGSADEPTGDVYQVYFLGGQSNMAGYGFVRDLPASEKGAVPNVHIFQGKKVQDGQFGGGVGTWVPLTPGHGVGFETDGEGNTLSNRFGPELSFGRMLNSQNPEAKIAIVKYALGGTGLVHGVSGYGSWDPDYMEGNRRNQYDNALTAISEALSVDDIDGDGRDDVLVPAGIIWMQGEADAFDNFEAASKYQANLTRMMALLRAALRVDDLPVVIGRIQDSGSTPETETMAYSHLVQSAQAEYVRVDPCASLVTKTETFEFLPDRWHYRSENYIALGEAFAVQVSELQANCPPGPTR